MKKFKIEFEVEVNDSDDEKDITKHIKALLDLLQWKSDELKIKDKNDFLRELMEEYKRRAEEAKRKKWDELPLPPPDCPYPPWQPKPQRPWAPWTPSWECNNTDTLKYTASRVG